MVLVGKRLDWYGRPFQHSAPKVHTISPTVALNFLPFSGDSGSKLGTFLVFFAHFRQDSVVKSPRLSTVSTTFGLTRP